MRGMACATPTKRVAAGAMQMAVIVGLLSGWTAPAQAEPEETEIKLKGVTPATQSAQAAPQAASRDSQTLKSPLKVPSRRLSQPAMANQSRRRPGPTIRFRSRPKRRPSQPSSANEQPVAKPTADPTKPPQAAKSAAVNMVQQAAGEAAFDERNSLRQATFDDRLATEVLLGAIAGRAAKTPATPELNETQADLPSGSPGELDSPSERPLPADKLSSPANHPRPNMPAMATDLQVLEVPAGSEATVGSEATAVVEPPRMPAEVTRQPGPPTAAGPETMHNHFLSNPRRQPPRGTEAASLDELQQARHEATNLAGLIQVAEEDESPFEIIDHTGELTVMLRRSKLLRTTVDIYRTAVVDPTICEVVQFTPREVAILGQSQGATHVTFWFEDDTHRPMTYLVRVVPDTEVQERREEQYQILEDLIAELFPDSKVKLIPVADKLIVRGQARDAQEASQIMTLIRGESVYNGRGGSTYGGLYEGQAADPLAGQSGQGLPTSQVINMLRIPGEQQVALKVKIAELNRSAARRFGVDLNLNAAQDGMAHLVVRSLLNAGTGQGTASLVGSFGNAGNPLDVALNFLEQEGVVRVLSEPTLVTLSGRPASFIAGGEFAVPTVVGVAGASAVTTDFRAFGAIISFLPVVLDKDRIRLQVAPEFSKINTNLSVGDIPGLDSRSVTTTVEMREGQTLVIAGLLDESMSGDLSGDIPFLKRILGMRTMTRNETELVILVTPELVHPMEPEEVPPLPGFDVTEPTNTEFYLRGMIEGKPTREYRSTVWPRLQRRYRAGSSAMISGPFGHGE